MEFLSAAKCDNGVDPGDAAQRKQRAKGGHHCGRGGHRGEHGRRDRDDDVAHTVPDEELQREGDDSPEHEPQRGDDRRLSEPEDDRGFRRGL